MARWARFLGCLAVLLLAATGARAESGTWYPGGCYYRSVMGGPVLEGCHEMVMDEDGFRWLAYYDDTGVYGLRIIGAVDHYLRLSPGEIRNKVAELLANNRMDAALLLRKDTSPPAFCPAGIPCLNAHSCAVDQACVDLKLKP